MAPFDGRPPNVLVLGGGGLLGDARMTGVLAGYKGTAYIVPGTRANTVVVAAARLADWTRLAPQLQRAVASFSS